MPRWWVTLVFPLVLAAGPQALAQPLDAAPPRRPSMARSDRKAFLVAGLLTFNVVYGLSSLAGGLLASHESRQWAWLQVPVAGPFIACGTVPTACPAKDPALAITILVLDGAMQGLGLGYIIAALVDQPAARSKDASQSATLMFGLGSGALRVSF
jgi:hypothetical protein